MYLFFFFVGIDKNAWTDELVLQILNEFLFPASMLTEESSKVRPSGIIDVSAK